MPPTTIGIEPSTSEKTSSPGLSNPRISTRCSTTSRRRSRFTTTRVTRIYDIDNIFEQTEREIGYTIPFERYKIVEFCNLGSCAQLISQEMLAGVFMPLRFIVYQERGADAASIAFLKPSAFARQFGSRRSRQRRRCWRAT